ncbi:MAG: RlmE family RNA methyltransferase [Thermoplasmata archaeon YP2-bin.285]|uniref:Ribosomal RNA large subunit methyltransferase E n=1 Tax=Candidatus Sysuiplasma superficiale TaxID=2823368 RepID=A0A8J7YIH6_9ARCH|nr:RlmE family RNA methyltransferase [Candidatus Sysuiplasma superficiale]
MGRRWMKERKRDTYYLRAKREDYRSRAAYKLLQLQDKFHFMFEGMRCVDLGAAPGGWLQVELEIAGQKGRVIGVDVTTIRDLDGAILVKGDVTDSRTIDAIRQELNGNADVVLSDMAPNISGNYDLDHERSADLVLTAFSVAGQLLEQGGHFVAKLFEGRRSREIREAVSGSFRNVSVSKPAASRKQSSETYIIGMDFRG